VNRTKNIANILRFNLVILLVLLGVNAFSQNDVSIYGVVRYHEDSRKIGGVTISILEDDVNFNTVTSNSSGKYEFVIGFEHVYKIIYTYPNYVTKYLTIDTRYVPEDEREGGYEMNIDMTLFQEIEGLDISILDNPIGKAQYDSNEGRMGWDMAYTRQMQAQINSLMREHDKKMEEEAERLAKKLEDFKELVRKGDDAVKNQKFADGVDLYADALVLFPDDAEVKEKKANAERAVEEMLANKAKEDQYNSLISSGDTFFGNEEWEDALASYESALKIFPNETYPKKRITEINDKLDAIRKNAANETMVAKLIKEGDALVSKDKFDEGIAKYNEALGLIPGHKKTTEQLSAANELKLAWLASQEKEKNYNDLIAKADEQFNANEFRKAISIYNDALAIKSGEKYPKDQIVKAEKIIADASAEAEKKRKFEVLVTQGDDKVNNKNYQEGIDLYKEALVIYPNNEAVEQKVSDAQKAIAAMMAAGEKDEKYKSLITKADKELTAKSYENAKSTYEEALSVKENESYPKQKIAEINEIIAGIAASQEALAQKELQEKFDKMVAQGDGNVTEQKYGEAITNYEQALDLIPDVKEVEDKIDDVKRKQQDLLANKAKDEQYNEWIATGDRYFSNKRYEDSKDAYLEALLLFDKDYPKERIAEIDQLIKELASQEEENEKMNEFNRLEKEGDEYVAAEEYQDAISSYSAALKIMSDQTVVEKKAQAEKDLAAMNMSMAFADQYKSIIEKADKAFEKKDYSKSRNLYQDAFAVIPEDYPKNQIKEIDRLILEQERRNAEEEAARLASVKTEEEWNSNTSDEERYIKEVEKEKKRMDDANYEELLAYKEALRKSNQEFAERGESLRSQNASVISAEREKNEDLFAVGEDINDKKVYDSNEEIEAYNAWLQSKNDEQLTASRDAYDQLINEQKEFNKEQFYKTEQYKEMAKKLKSNKEDYQNFNYTKSQEHAQKIRKNYYQSQEMAKEQYRVFSEGKLRESNIKEVNYEKEDKEEFDFRKEREQRDRIANYEEESERIRNFQKEQASNDAKEVKQQYKELENENEMRNVEENRWKNHADVKRDLANEESRSTDYSGKKDYEDYVPNNLVKKYDQGVTEETYEEGNAKIVKRIVVRGNKADEYKMVVMRSGTYYFKNGNSITKFTWNNDTEIKDSYRD